MPAPPNLTDKAAFVDRMEPALKRATALLAGTDAMRAAGEEYLPKFPGEHIETYKWRLAVAVLNNFYEAMAGQMVGMMFKKRVTWAKPSKIDKAILDNLDKRGGTVDTLAADIARALLTKGRPHIFVDHPKKPEGAETRADDMALGLRPYWVLMEPACVFNAWADTENGDERLGDIRWREWGSRRIGYGMENVERIRMLARGPEGVRFEKWERAREGDQYELAEAGALSTARGPLGEIPIVTLYSDRQAFMVAKPTLDDIAHKNIEHWQSSADQRHILTVSRFPIMYQLGTKTPVALVGPYSMYHTDTSKNDAEIGYAEAEGKGTEHGWKDLSRIVSEAEAMAVRIITSDAAKTDSGEQIDYAKEGSKLQKLSVEVERGINQALIHTARWLGLPDDAAGQVQTPKDFGLDGNDAKAIDQLIQMRAAGDLSQPTLWAEAVERSLFKTKFDPKKEAQLIEDEKARNMETALTIATGMAGGGNDNPDDPEDEDPEAAAAEAA